jgi:hypothetical protein
MWKKTVCRVWSMNPLTKPNRRAYKEFLLFSSFLTRFGGPFFCPFVG